MCFDRVEKFKVHRYYGWKVFESKIDSSKVIFNLFRDLENHVPINKWLTSN